MQLADQQEEFSYAYIHAVATVAGYGVTRANRIVDNAGIDLIISALGDRNLPREPSLHVQVKCTYQDIRRQTQLAYSLDTKTHHRLCREVSTSRILVVVFVPNTPADWLTHSEDELICGIVAIIFLCAARRPQPTRPTRQSICRVPNDLTLPPCRALCKE